VSKLLQEISDFPKWVSEGPFNCGSEVPCFSYVCYICHDTRDVEEFIDFYHDETACMIEQLENGGFDVSILTENFFSNCYFQIRNQSK
jgi:hypothetical protein